MAKPPTHNTKLSSCFSFAAYAKILIKQLSNLNIQILPGLTDHEFSSLESSLRFSFPPDLRSILREGLPVSPNFPNWHSSSPHELQKLLNLPLLNLSKIMSHTNFWLDSWGPNPDDSDQALEIAKRFSDQAPVLVPIYGNCYIPASPNAAGNPVFYVDEWCVRVLSFDISRFFQELEFLQTGDVHLIQSVRNDNSSVNLPAWAATEERRVEFWTEVAERGRRTVARWDTRGWWSGRGEWELGSCLEGVFWRLRDGGWEEEEVRDMMMMVMDGCDEAKGDVTWHVSGLSVVLLRGGWSTEDVVDSLDLSDVVVDDESVVNKSCFELKIPKSSSCLRENGDRRTSRVKQLMDVPSVP